MNKSIVGIMDLPDEMIMEIWTKLNKTDVIYSFAGVNKRFDKLIRDPIYIRSIQLIKANSLSKRTIDRYCSEILPEIHHLIECLASESCCIGRILLCGDYPRLRKLNLISIGEDFASNYFTDESPFAKLFKEKITHLVVKIAKMNTIKSSYENLGKNIVSRIFRTFESLIDLDFGRPLISISQLSPTICFSSSKVILRIIVHTLDDCLCLLDGRLPHIRKLSIRINQISAPKITIVDNLKVLSNMKSFSLTTYGGTTEYDQHIVPLVRQMKNLEDLLFYISSCQRLTFIDGAHFENEILAHMPHLRTFTFNMITYTDSENIQSNDDIRRSFVNWRYGRVDCYTDVNPNNLIRSHIYSLPYRMIDMNGISNSFPGWKFSSVRILYLSDRTRPFEQEFFVRIASAFPFISDLTILNNRTPLEKTQSTSPLTLYSSALEVKGDPECIAYSRRRYTCE